MKYLWALVGGLLVGAAAGGVLLYFNPLTGSRAAEIGAFDRVLRYRFPADVSVFTHGGRAPLPLQPAGVAELWETTVRSSALGALTLSEDDGRPEAVASRIIAPSDRTELLGRGMIANDYWLVTVPGAGSLFVVAESNLWPLIKDTVLPVTLLGRPWSGTRSYVPTDGPGLRGTALVVGATGGFEAQEGSALERYRVNEFNRSEGLAELSGELHLRLVDPIGDQPE